MDASDLFVDQSEILSLSFRNFSLALEKCSVNREALETSLSRNFLEPFGRIVDSDLGSAQKACKSLHQARLELDSVKSRLRSAKPDRIEKLSEELREAEQTFTFALETAILRMKAVLDNKELVKHVNAVIEGLVAYHKSCYEALNSLVI